MGTKRLAGGVGTIGIISAAITLWSEVTVAVTRCGPQALPNWLERSSYLTVFVVVACSILARLIAGSSLASLLDSFGPKSSRIDGAYRTVFSTAEALSLLVIVVATVVLGAQLTNGDALADGAGLTGIDVNRCSLLLQ
mmetsp:Transcript_5305/g.8492  ORF Transcript_5305/g.8492 Transcript_5305/m.8492 type:complete len:138 (-) Transcript_5305:1637-2050(-)